MQLHKHITQKDKSKIRHSNNWKILKEELELRYRHSDILTNDKLKEDFSCHHLDLNPNNYSNFADITHFVPLNKSSHEFLHFIYRYYAKDPSILNRLKDLLDKMILLNEFDNKRNNPEINKTNSNNNILY